VTAGSGPAPQTVTIDAAGHDTQPTSGTATGLASVHATVTQLVNGTPATTPAIDTDLACSGLPATGTDPVTCATYTTPQLSFCCSARVTLTFTDRVGNQTTVTRDVTLTPQPKPSGAPDTTFGTGGVAATAFDGGDGQLTDATVTSSGDIVETGTYTATNSSTRELALTRLHANGTLDTAFGSNGRVVQPNTTFTTTMPESVVAVPGDKVVVLGSGTEPGRVFATFAERFDANGSLDPTFGTGGVTITTPTNGNLAFGTGRSVTQPNGDIITAGSEEDQFGAYHMVVYRYTPNGQLDPTFGNAGIAMLTFPTGQSHGYDVALQPDGYIDAVGFGQNGPFLSATWEYGVARLTPSGNVDTTFATNGYFELQNPVGNDFFDTIKLDSHNRLVVGGSAQDTGFSHDHTELFRLEPNGTLDSSFGSNGQVSESIPTGGYGIYYDLVIRPNDGIIATTPTINGNQIAMALVGYNPDGSVDSSFGTGGITTTQVGTGDTPETLVVMPDGRILLNGLAAIGNSQDFIAAAYSGDTP
jgi:uncharacterized delta-60 repeat protein